MTENPPLAETVREYVTSINLASEFEDMEEIPDAVRNLRQFVQKESNLIRSQIADLGRRCKRQGKLTDQLVCSFVKMVECINKLQHNQHKLMGIKSDSEKKFKESDIHASSRLRSCESLHSRSRSTSSSDLSLYRTYRHYMTSPVARSVKHYFHDLMQYVRVNRDNVVTILIILAALTVIYSLLFRAS